jgi:hypothetical protein
MLRLFVLMLFAVNLLLLGWALSRPAAPPESADTAASAGFGGETIYLLSELTADEDLLASNRHCFTLGPMQDADLFEITRFEIGQKAVSVSERRSEALVELGHWVYLSIADDPGRVTAMVAELQQAGIDDVTVVPGSEGETLISLGYYSRQASAIGRAGEIEALGYQPKTSIRRETQQRFWLDYELQPGVELPGLAANRRTQPVDRRVIPCSKPTEDAAGDSAVPLLSANPGSDGNQPAEESPES